MQYRFFYKELQWKYLNSDNIWIAQNPPLPDWAEQFLPIFFVKIWVKSRYMNDIHKALFWLSRTEIENYYEEINLALQECGYEELHDLDSLSDVTLTSPIINGEILRYNSGSGEWENSTNSLYLLNEVETSMSPIEGDVMRFNAISSNILKII